MVQDKAQFAVNGESFTRAATSYWIIRVPPPAGKHCAVSLNPSKLPAWVTSLSEVILRPQYFDWYTRIYHLQ